MLLGESVQRFSLPHAASEAEAYQMRLRHLKVKEQILDTFSTEAAFANQLLMGIGRQYEGTDLPALAKTMVEMRGKVIILERTLGVEQEKMTPEEIKNKLAEWRAKAWDWDNYVMGAAKKSSGGREVEREEDAQRQVDHDGTDHTAEEARAALIPVSNPASPKPLLNQSEVEVKEDRKKQQAKLKKAIDANRLLQAKLRQVSDNRNRWSEYCEHLQKKLERSNALLKEHQVTKGLVRTVEPEEGGSWRPQIVEREEAVIDVVTREKENERSTAIIPPAEQRYQSPYISRLEAGAPRGAIQILPSNAKICRGDDNGRLPSLLVDTHGKHSAYGKDIGSWPDKKRGPRYSEGHPMARGGLDMAECSTDALEVMHDKEPPPKQMLKVSSMKEAGRFARTMLGETLHPNGVVASRPRDVDVTETSGPNTQAGTQQAGIFHKNAIPPEPASESPPPKLPRLLHTTTVADSLASSSSFSQHHTSSTQAEHPTSGADTINAEEANQANAAAVRPLPSDDEPPIVVSERNIRKRKNNDSPPKRNIKQERIESSPIALLGLRHLQTQESMDLDDIGPKTTTPKKRRKKQSAAGASGLVGEYAPAQIYPQAPKFGPGRDEEEEEEGPATPLPPKSSPGTPSVPPSAVSILKPRSTNPILPGTSVKTYSAKRRRISDKGADLYSEDGENHLRAADAEEATVETPSKAVPRALAGRLAGLLEKPSPRRWQVMNMDDEPDSPLAADSNSAAEPTKALSTISITAPSVLQIADEEEARSKKAYEDGEAKQAKGRGRQRQRQDVPSTARPEEEPLATRPVSSLSLDDFKINPEYNNGLNYAYRDVVRGREKRKCLAGCTDPSCCGKGFRALAEIATPIRDNLTPSQREEEDKLLTEFLGRDASTLINHLGKEERRETLIKAKTRELANKHGKHRHAYERRKSPPGFWRADFPTTQEEAEDREKAKVFERDLVQKRYEEAMRGGGKWIFKDQMGE